MVVGASGLGRTTFVNTLCGKQILRHEPPDYSTPGVRIRPVSVGKY
jgi:cell division control protein 11